MATRVGNREGTGDLTRSGEDKTQGNELRRDSKTSKQKQSIDNCIGVSVIKKQ